MKIGGSARNDGVSFVSENFSAKFTFKSNGEIEIKAGKNRAAGNAIIELMEKIPFLRAISKVIASNKLLLFCLASQIVMDIVFAKSSDGTQLSTGMQIMLIIILVIALICLLYALNKVLFRSKRTWTFHGAEHKTIYAVENGIELNVENVRGCPRIAKRCGTNFVVFMLPIYYVSSIFIPHGSVCIILAISVAYELFNIKKGDKLPIISLFYKLGYWCQQRFFTAEPTDEQLEAAIATMRRLIELEKSEKISQTTTQNA